MRLMKLLFGFEKGDPKMKKIIDITFLVLMLGMTAYLWFIEKPKNEMIRNCTIVWMELNQKYIGFKIEGTTEIPLINTTDICQCNDELPHLGE